MLVRAESKQYSPQSYANSCNLLPDDNGRPYDSIRHACQKRPFPLSPRISGTLVCQIAHIRSRFPAVFGQFIILFSGPFNGSILDIIHIRLHTTDNPIKQGAFL